MPTIATLKNHWPTIIIPGASSHGGSSEGIFRTGWELPLCSVEQQPHLAGIKMSPAFNFFCFLTNSRDTGVS
jgi:hypothetical protein